MKKQIVLCAMSGGVDSSVAAAILKKQGYEVIGIFMKLWSEGTGAEAAIAARAVANHLKIPFYILNLEKEFKKAVVDYYIKEYEKGRTPNPCVICNRDIKGEVLLRKVLEMKADFLATGHYARLRREIRNPKSEIRNYRYQLLQAKDKEKDQTYFLWMLKQEQLKQLLFPIGDYLKSEVRALAKKWQLPSAERKESQGVCFIPDRDLEKFLRRHAHNLTKPGEIVDLQGNKLGLHQGLLSYTIGQRERLGIGGPKAYYVVKLKSKENLLVVGDEKDLYQKKLIAADLNWLDKPFYEQEKIGEIKAKIRYGHSAENCQMKAIENKQVKVSFDRPQRAITPGQSIVFYSGEKALGGGIIQ